MPLLFNVLVFSKTNAFCESSTMLSNRNISARAFPATTLRCCENVFHAIDQMPRGPCLDFVYSFMYAERASSSLSISKLKRIALITVFSL